MAIGRAGDVTVTASKDGYVAASSQVTVAESEVLSLDFELTQQNESVTLSPDAELALEEKRGELTTTPIRACRNRGINYRIYYTC